MTLLLLFNQPESAPGGSSSGTAFSSFVEAGMFLGQWEIDDNLTFTACIHDATGAAADADAVPTYAVYEDESAVALVSGDMAKLGAVTGFYTEALALSAANGFEEGKCYAIRVQATVGGVVAAASHVFQLGAMVKIAGAKNTLDALNDAPDVSADVTAVKGVTDKLDTALELDGAVYRYTTNALEQAAAGAGLTAQEVRDAMKLAPTAGAAAADSIDDKIDSISAGAGSGTGTYTDTVTDGANPLDGVRVQLSTDAAGTNRVYETYTDATGVFTLHPDPGTYYVWLDLAGFTFAYNGTEVVVA